jgi:hypothetical protein
MSAPPIRHVRTANVNAGKASTSPQMANVCPRLLKTAEALLKTALQPMSQQPALLECVTALHLTLLTVDLSVEYAPNSPLALIRLISIIL